MAPVFRTLEGRAPYADTVEAMKAHAAAIRAGTAGEEVWFLEHHPVLTGGTSADIGDLVDPGDIPVHETGRGGQWTWHGPGQRVAYVMLDLQRRRPDVRAYVHDLESWIIAALSRFGVEGMRREGLPGGLLRRNCRLAQRGASEKCVKIPQFRCCGTRFVAARRPSSDSDYLWLSSHVRSSRSISRRK